MHIHDDLIMYLMYKYNWNKEKLEEIYYDQLAQKYMELTRKIKAK
jgi:hypothetical protein